MPMKYSLVAAMIRQCQVGYFCNDSLVPLLCSATLYLVMT